MTNLDQVREAMVERQLRRRGIVEPHILDAFRQVPREQFVSAANEHLAYGDHPLPIEAGQATSQPYIVALMIQAAGIAPSQRVFEVGAGSGYAAALISRVAARVVGIERQHELVEVARERMSGSAIRMSRSSRATARGAGPNGRPMTRSLPRRAEVMCQ